MATTSTPFVDSLLPQGTPRKRLLLLDMDCILTQGSFLEKLARATGHAAELPPVLECEDSVQRHLQLAHLFHGIHQRTFEVVAHALTLRPEAIDFVAKMQRRGFMVGIVSDSYSIATDIVRRKIFADFALANTMQFANGICTGSVSVHPAFLSSGRHASPSVCKSHVLRYLEEDYQSDTMHQTWVVGDKQSDLALMRLADHAFVIQPQSPGLLSEPGITVIASFADLLILVDLLAQIAQRELHEIEMA